MSIPVFTHTHTKKKKKKKNPQNVAQNLILTSSDPKLTLNNSYPLLYNSWQIEIKAGKLIQKLANCNLDNGQHERNFQGDDYCYKFGHVMFKLFLLIVICDLMSKWNMPPND